MKTKVIKMIKILLMIMLILNIAFKYQPYVYAASQPTISCNATAEVGKPVTVSVQGIGVQWNLALKIDGTQIATSSELENYEKDINVSFSGTYTPTKAGTLNVTLEGSLTAFDGSTITNFSGCSKQIVVSEPKVEEPQEPEENNTGNEGQTPSAGQNTVIPQDPPKQEEPEESPKSQNNHLSSLVVSDGVRELQLKQTRTDK